MVKRKSSPVQSTASLDVPVDLHGAGALARDPIRAGAVDPLAAHADPACELGQQVPALVVDRAVWPLRDVQEQVPVLGDDVDQDLDHVRGRLVDVADVVEPVTHRGVGLPRLGLDVRLLAPFDVQLPTR